MCPLIPPPSFQMEIVGDGADPDILPQPHLVGHPAGGGAQHLQQPARDRYLPGALSRRSIALRQLVAFGIRVWAPTSSFFCLPFFGFTWFSLSFWECLMSMSDRRRSSMLNCFG